MDARRKALLFLRRADEREAQRVLAVARAELGRSQAEQDAARHEVHRVAQLVGDAESARATGRAVTVGALARAREYADRRRQELETVEAALALTEAKGIAAAGRLEVARAALEEAVRRREALSEEVARARRAEARKRERREPTGR